MSAGVSQWSNGELLDWVRDHLSECPDPDCAVCSTNRAVLGKLRQRLESHNSEEGA